MASGKSILDDDSPYPDSWPRSEVDSTNPRPETESFLIHDDEARPRLPGLRLAGLSCLILGVQVFWYILMSHGTSYLRSLGFSEALTSLVWMGGPIGSVVFAPIIGSWSDGFRWSSRSPFRRLGRRKPFIFIGTLGVIGVLLILAYIREICEVVGLFAGYRKKDVQHAFGPDGSGNWVVVTLAFIAVYTLSIFINTLQIMARALIVDCVIPEQQKEAMAWMSRWSCTGAVFSFWLGSVDLPEAVPFLGRSQFKALTVVEIIILLIVLPTVLFSSQGLESPPPSTGREKLSPVTLFKDLYKNARNIPKPLWEIFRVQFWSWLSWFPFLYYHTTWVGLLASYDALNRPGKSPSHPSHGQPSVHGETPEVRAARIGSFAAFLYSLTSLGITIILPAISQRVAYLTVERLWTLGHIVFTVLMLLTLFVDNVTTGTILVAILGFSWAMTQWAPFALLASAVSQGEKDARQDTESSAGDDGSESKQVLGAGAALGLHNVAMGLPQIFAGLGTAIVFKLCDIFGSDDKLGWGMRLAGLTCLGAIWTTRQMTSR